jgi:uncharacterized protein
MKFNEMAFEGAVPVDSYGPNFFRVSGAVHEGAMLLCESDVVTWGGYSDVQSLVALKDRVDFILIGTGEALTYIPAELRSALEAEGIGVEGMATPTACRSYNILAAEGRRVAVALLPI